ncbi:MAG: hypothetical protein CFH40_02480, partial [Alphaproteobacteria bacterium MarineAlpha10_Bin3]
MAKAATDSCFDIAQWFVERARFEHSYLQAQKLQRLTQTLVKLMFRFT